MRKYYRLIGSLALGFSLLTCSSTAFGQVRLPKLINSGMVLQRNTNDRIWGWALPGEQVTVRFLGKDYKTTASQNGNWTVMLSPMKAGGPYAMEIDGTNHIILKNILVGDVWICSGQSNMELPMSRIEPRYRKLIAHSWNSKIRQFLVPDRYNFKRPQKDVQYGSWKSVTPTNVLHFSATAYFFARALYDRYHVPIGLVNASVGGTPISAWMSEDALGSFPKYLKRGEKFSDPGYLDSVVQQDNKNQAKWDKYVWGHDKGLQGPQKWYDPNYNDSNWKTMKLPGFWANEGLGNVNGVVWFRKEFNATTSIAREPATLWLGRIVDADYVYINGIFVGSISYQWPPRIYHIAPGVIRQGINNITIRVVNYAGKGGFLKGKPYEIAAGGKQINLEGDWKYKVGAAAEKPLPGRISVQNQPMGLFNGMIAPLMNYSIKGAIWYQGESNTGSPGVPDQYHQMFSEMIKDWRMKWGEGDFPFLFVQLPNFGPPVTDPSSGSNWARIRQAQLETLSLPKTGMAVTIDIGEWNDVHPLDKKDVGNRLGLVAQKVAYGENVDDSGPIYRSMKVERNKIILSFDHVDGGLVAEGGKINDFAIAGDDHHFVWANAKIENNKVMVWSDKVAHPKVVRYAWADNPPGANLYNKKGLPASPFSTDQ